jgi:uncharacterized protein (DUF4415 family)
MHVVSKGGRVFDLPSAEDEAKIRQGIAGDGVDGELADSDLARLLPTGRPPGRPKAAVTKQAVSLRLSPEVVTYFKATGPGWQTRLDAVLKDYVAGREPRP